MAEVMRDLAPRSVRAFSRSTRGFVGYVRFLGSAWKYVSVGGTGVLLLASFLNAISNIVRIVTMFLPLKLLILMQGEHVPRYMAPLMQFMDRQAVIGLVIVAIPILYVFYMLLGLAFRKLTRRDLERVERGNRMLRNMPMSRRQRRHLHWTIATIQTDVMVVIIAMTVIFTIGWVFGTLLSGMLFALSILVEYVMFRRNAHKF